MREHEEDRLNRGWKKWLGLAARDYRHGFEDGIANKYMELGPNLSDAYLDGFASGSELFRQEYEASARDVEINNNASYDEMAKGA